LRFSLVTKSYQPEATASECAKQIVRYLAMMNCMNRIAIGMGDQPI